MRFLLTNDDGIDAPGLAALQSALHSAAGGEVESTVVAPHEHVSGCGHQTTTHRPLRVLRPAPGRFAVDGSPADCVRLGLLHLAAPTDWVLSGVNDGGNLGVDVFMSGTVAGAREAVLFGHKAAAFSHYRRRGCAIDWTWATKQTERVLRMLLSMSLPPGSFWNVNLPAATAAEPDPDVVFCPLERSPLHVCYEQVDDCYHFRGAYHERKRSAGNDVDLCFSGRITITQVALV